MDLLLQNLASVLVFSLTGLAILALAFYVFDKLSPGELWEEIVHKQNLPLALTASAFIIAIAIIISAAIHG